MQLGLLVTLGVSTLQEGQFTLSHCVLDSGHTPTIL